MYHLFHFSKDEDKHRTAGVKNDTEEKLNTKITFISYFDSHQNLNEGLILRRITCHNLSPFHLMQQDTSFLQINDSR